MTAHTNLNEQSAETIEPDKHLREQTIAHTIAFHGNFLTVQRDQVRLPNGEQAQREFILHPGAAMIVPLFEDGTVLLERQYRHPLGRVFIEFPAGKIDDHEDALSTAKRELLEETGYTATQWLHLRTIHNAIAYSNERIELYLATGLAQGEQQLDDGEFIECIRIPLDDLISLIDQGVVTDVKTIIGAYAVERLFKTNPSLGSK